MNDLFLRALRCEKVDRPPIWIMRQAGRYLPKYQALRARHSFHTLVHTPELAAEVTRLPIDLLGFDAAILFSDILVIAEVFGFTMDFTTGPDGRQDGQGRMNLTSPTQEIELPVNPTLQFVSHAIRLLKPTLQVPLIGFCGGPYTVCRYMKRLTPAWLEKVTAASLEYLKMQVEAGVDVIQIFDSWAGLLPPDEFRSLALPYLAQLVEGMRPSGVPLILFCRGSSRYIPELVSLNPAGIGFDWEMEMAEVRRQVPSSIAVQGNLNPDLLKGPLASLQLHADHLLQAMEGSRGYLFNLGHGILPDTPVENVKWLLRRVQG